MVVLDQGHAPPDNIKWLNSDRSKTFDILESHSLPKTLFFNISKFSMYGKAVHGVKNPNLSLFFRVFYWALQVSQKDFLPSIPPF